MSNQGHTIKEFPDVDNKLRAPYKKSQFEKQREEAEKKRIREEAENAAALRAFQEEFEDDDCSGANTRQGGYDQRGVYGGGDYGQGGYGGRGGPPSRGMEPGRGPPGPHGGRGFSGGLGGPPPRGVGSLGPPPPSMRSRELEGFGRPLAPPQRKNPNDRRDLGFDDRDSHRQRSNDRTDRGRKIPAAFSTSDDEYERTDMGYRKPAEPEVPKPTLQLNTLPPGTSPAAIKALLPGLLRVDDVRILPPPPNAASSTERRSISAIVTLSRETASSDIDTAVSSLRGNYLGYGHYLSLHRHLSTAALSSAPITITYATGTSVAPFGAKFVDTDPAKPQGSLNRQPPPGSYKGFAPPSSYSSSAPAKPLGPILHVPVQPPSDVREIRLIHKTIELLLTHGPEFEALLMSRPDVQKEEKWAWIWNARSKGGIWYRWRLWSLLTGSDQKGRYVPLFEDAPAWRAPEKSLSNEYATKLEEFVEDEDYASSEDDFSDDEAMKPVSGLGLGEDEGPKFLGPMQKAHLVHLLARLPPNVQKLRRGDVARITGFALKNSRQGAHEIVQMLVENVVKPYSHTSANPAQKSRPTPPTSGSEGKEKEREDTSSSSLVALRLIPDIIASALNSGVPSARNFRALFETELSRRKVFEHLGRLEKKFGWGRMSSEKWRDAVKRELSRWRDGSLFLPGKPEEWLDAFARVEGEEKEARRKEEEERKRESRWKTVPDKVAPTAGTSEASAMEVEEDVDGAPMDEDEDVDGVPMADSDEDVDGEPMAVDEAEQTVEASAEPPAQAVETKQEEATRLKRQRPKAEDMFADSDSD